MVITYHGGQCVKVIFGDMSLVFNPISKNSSLPPVKFGADIALVSQNNLDMNGIAEVSYGDKKPFVISGPGEYEYKNVLVRGYLSGGSNVIQEQPDSDTKAVMINTTYIVEIEGMTLMHLGSFRGRELPNEIREAINNIDILFIPIMGDINLSAEDAHSIITSLDPRVIIPMYKSSSGDKNSLDYFLKDEGVSVKQVNKITLKKKDVLEENGTVIVLQA